MWINCEKKFEAGNFLFIGLERVYKYFFKSGLL